MRACSNLEPEMENDKSTSLVQISLCTRRNARARSDEIGAACLYLRHVRSYVKQNRGPVGREMRLYKPQSQRLNDGATQERVPLRVKLRFNYTPSSAGASASLPRQPTALDRASTISQPPVDMPSDARGSTAAVDGDQEEKEHTEAGEVEQATGGSTTANNSITGVASPGEQVQSPKASSQAASQPTSPKKSGFESPAAKAQAPATHEESKEEEKGNGFVKAIIGVIGFSLAAVGGAYAYTASGHTVPSLGKVKALTSSSNESGASQKGSKIKKEKK